MNPTQLLQSIPVCELTGALSVPICPSSTIVQQAPGLHKGYDDSLTNNPTCSVLENTMAAFEGGASASAFASGLAAIEAIVCLLEPGNEILAADNLYSGMFRQFSHIHQKKGIRISYIDTTNLSAIIQNLTPNTKMIWIETPTNPTLRISDIQAIAKIARETGCLLTVDNTLASPVMQKPMELGADIVVHSATKYLEGHSDLIAGIVVTRDQETGNRIRSIQDAAGSILSPFDSWLVIRGLETIHLRIRQYNLNALRVARFLQGHLLVKQVYYPGLPSHDGYDISKRQSSGFGGIVSFTLHEDSEAAARKLVTSTRIFKLSQSLGGAKSLICHPATMTHKSIPTDRRLEMGVTTSLIRLSVGLEQAIDLIHDINAAIGSTSRTKYDNGLKKEFPEL